MIDRYSKLYDLIIDFLSDEYKYKAYDGNIVIQDIFRLCLNERGIPEVPDKKYNIIHKETDLLIAGGYERVVFGKYGAFIEISSDDINKNVITKSAKQRFRERLTNRKYDHYTINWYRDNIKIYHQLKGVSYADYRVGYFYIGITEDIIIEPHKE